MTPQERDLILSVVQRLRGAAPAEKDPDADRLIRSEIGTQPDALYRLTQAVIVQELGLRHAEERIQQLEAELAAVRPQRQGSFLGGPFVGGQAPAPASVPAPAAPAGGGSGVGSFLATAAATAAGVVGGNLIYDGVSRLAHGSWGSFASDSGGGFLGSGPHFGGGTPDATAEPADVGSWENLDVGEGEGGAFDDTDEEDDADDFGADDDQGGGGDF